MQCMRCVTQQLRIACATTRQHNHCTVLSNELLRCMHALHSHRQQKTFIVQPQMRRNADRIELVPNLTQNACQKKSILCTSTGQSEIDFVNHNACNFAHHNHVDCVCHNQFDFAS